MEIKYQWLGWFSTKLIQILCILFFAGALLFSFKNGMDIYLSKRDIQLFVGPLLIGIIALGLYILFVNRYISNKVFLLLLIVFSFLLRLGWVLLIKTPPESDFLILYRAAIDAAKGDFSFSETLYFSSWVYQIGFTMFQALIISLFGKSLFILKFLNILFTVGIVVVIYLIARKLVNETAGRIAGLLYAVYPSSIAMTSVLTNDHLSTLLFYLGFYLIITIKRNTLKAGLLIGLLIGLGNIIRPLGSLILLAILLYFLVYKIILANKDQRMPAIRSIIGIFASYFIIMNVVSYAFIAGGVTDYPLSNRAPYWKFLVGFNHETKGNYSAEDSAYMSKFALGAERDSIEKDLVLERLSDKKQVLMLFYDKFQIMWGYRDSSIIWSMSKVDMPFYFHRVKIFEHSIYLFMLFLSLISMLKLKPKNGLLLFMILTLGYVSVHFLIEIQTRYRYFIIPTFAMLAGGGFTYILGKFNIAKNKKITGENKV
ncbi:hypothetical protein E1I69_15380 [Bacillus timonensis]|uniref:Glycosyltransferase RgtA/B/C/D-like domain-containing protein n=1 Tax=Bacillus timonensis TaxID=1033734 RepID=A0A4S3PRD5_9BACI|nr:glycosyltransferase family 39 protein [Bacillus timonensis]THE11342.1 hypothetical protein E1I69_15380 [Bacillus timonensis]